MHQKVGGDTQTGFPKARMRVWEKGETRIALFGIAESNADKQCEFRRVPCTPATTRAFALDPFNGLRGREKKGMWESVGFCLNER